MQLYGQLISTSAKSVRLVLRSAHSSSSSHPRFSLARSTLDPVISVAPTDASLRTLTLEYLSRVAISDIPKESIQSLLSFCEETLQNSHEEDGSLAHQIISDIFKAYKSLEDLSTPYLQWLVQLFDSIPEAADKYIGGSGKKSNVEEPIPAACSIKLSQDIAMSMFTFRTLSPCKPVSGICSHHLTTYAPLQCTAAFSLFQAYPRKLTAFGPDLVSKMVTTVSLDVPAPSQDNPKALRLFSDLKLAQVKTLVFLVILSRSQTVRIGFFCLRTAVLCFSLVLCTLCFSGQANGRAAPAGDLRFSFIDYEDVSV